MEQFERVVLNCILYYNSKRIIENYPYTDDMLSKGVQPYASAIWNYGRKQAAADLIPVTREQLILTLLPRTTGRFSRSGLKVNQMRYRHDDYTEQYLQSGEAVVAYNPEDVGCVWLLDKGEYVRFDLIEGRYAGKNLSGVEQAQETRKQLVRAVQEESLQAQIDLADYIKTMCSTEPAWQLQRQARRRWALRPQYHQASVSPTLQLSFAAEARRCNEHPLDSHWLHRKPMKYSVKWNRRPYPGTGRNRHTRIITHRPSEARCLQAGPRHRRKPAIVRGPSCTRALRSAGDILYKCSAVRSGDDGKKEDAHTSMYP